MSDVTHPPLRTFFAAAAASLLVPFCVIYPFLHFGPELVVAILASIFIPIGSFLGGVPARMHAEIGKDYLLAATFGVFCGCLAAILGLGVYLLDLCFVFMSWRGMLPPG